MKRKLKGFTLVELVITIAIVIILSVISVPIYRGYVNKAQMSEGYALLGLILSAQKNYYSEYGMFLDDNFSSSPVENSFTCKEEVLGIDASTNKYYTIFNVSYSCGYTACRPVVQGKDVPPITLYYSTTARATFY